MAQRYSPVYPEFFSDPDLRKLPVEQHFFFLALWGNPTTTLSGVYAISLDILALFARCTPEQAREWLNGGRLKNVSWDEGTSSIFVHNALRYRVMSSGGNPEWLAQAVLAEREQVNSPLWREFDIVYGTKLMAAVSPEARRRSILKVIRGMTKKGKEKSKAQTPPDPRVTACQKVFDELFEKHFGVKPARSYAKDGALFKQMIAASWEVEKWLPRFF